MMKLLFSSKPLFHRLFVVSCLISITVMAGCSGSGFDSTAGVGSGGTGVLAKQISGTVADGYLVNATIFLDRNGNYQLDAGEPRATTDANGAYTITVDPADVGMYPLVVLAIKGVTIDKDTNQTLENSYVLSIPKESISNTADKIFISPITSLVREIMETGIHPTLQQAKDALATKMGLKAGTEIMSDYIATNSTTMHSTAQTIAVLMGNQMGQVLGTSGSSITVGVDRYRGMMGTIFSNMSSIKGSNSSNTTSTISDLKNSMTTVLSNMPMPVAGQPYRNMSTAFRGKMGH